MIASASGSFGRAWCAFSLVVLLWAGFPHQSAHAQTQNLPENQAQNPLENVSSNQVVEQEGWIAGSSVRLQTLDKITARIATMRMALRQPTRFGTLEITAYHCAYRPPEAPPETAAFLEIKDVGYTDSTEATHETVFSGWMFASSPAISALEHPVYDVSVLACAR